MQKPVRAARSQRAAGHAYSASRRPPNPLTLASYAPSGQGDLAQRRLRRRRPPRRPLAGSASLRGVESIYAGAHAPRVAGRPLLPRSSPAGRVRRPVPRRDSAFSRRSRAWPGAAVHCTLGSERRRCARAQAQLFRDALRGRLAVCRSRAAQAQLQLGQLEEELVELAVQEAALAEEAAALERDEPALDDSLLERLRRDAQVRRAASCLLLNPCCPRPC